MTHLAAARGFVEPLAIAEPAAFYLGSVAPDAYHWLRPEKSLADRARAHFTGGGDPRERIRERFAGAPTDFEAGYALHLLVDLFWDEAVLQPFLRDGTYAVYAHDMGVLDVHFYLRADAEEVIFPLLAAAEPRGLDDLISPEQVRRERDLTVAWYREKIALADERLRGPFSLSSLLAAADEAARFAARAWTLFRN